MRLLVRPLITIFFLTLFCRPVRACVDSFLYKIEPVQCFGLRNGKIKINKVFGGAAPYYYSVDGQSFSTNPVFEHLWAGDYTLSIRDASGCITDFPCSVPEPEELIVQLLASDSAVVAGKPLTLEAIMSPEDASLEKISWRPPDLFNTQNVLEQHLDISETTNFAVELVDKNGCTARSHFSVEVEQTNIYIPNVIKFDSGQDEYLTVYAGEGVKKIVYLRVYSRVGATIFEQLNFLPNDPFKGWNGRWDGKKVQSGVYLWLAQLELLDGTRKHFKGTVTVTD